MRTELWQFRFSHYNEKARWALDFKGWPHRRRSFVPGLHVAPLIRRTGQPKTPVLIVDEEVVCDSSAILAWLEQRCPDPSLVPADPDQRDRALDLEEWFDEEAGPRIRRLVYHHLMAWPALCARFSCAGAGRAETWAFRGLGPVLRPVMRWNMNIDAKRVAEAEAKIDVIFDRLEQELGPDGYLVGNRFTIADLTAASILANLVQPEAYPYAWTPMPPSLRAIKERHADRPGAAWVHRIYDRHRSPSAEVS